MKFRSRNSDLTNTEEANAIQKCKIFFMKRNKVTTYWIPTQGDAPITGICPLERFMTVIIRMMLKQQSIFAEHLLHARSNP